MREGDVLLLARETEQLERIAERLRKGRRVVAFIACDGDLRQKVAEWLSKASGRELAVPVEDDPAQLLTRMMALAEGTGGVESLAWKPGDREALATLNLHREKLRRGGGVLVWCALGDLTAVQTEAQDAFSFRDTLVVVEGFRLPRIHVPAGDTPEIELARARYELPGTPMEKALAAAELAKLLIERRRAEEAFGVMEEAVPPILEHRAEGATKGTFGFLEAVMTASFAMDHRPAEAWHFAKIAVDDLGAQGIHGDLTNPLADDQHPASESAVEAALALVNLASDGPLERLALHMARVYAAVAYEAGRIRAFLPLLRENLAVANVPDEMDEAGVLLHLAAGDLREARRLAVALVERSSPEDRDDRRLSLHLEKELLLEGERDAALRLGALLGSSVANTDLRVEHFLLGAGVLSMMGAPTRLLGEFQKRIELAQSDGVLFRTLRGYAGALSDLVSAGRLTEEEFLAAESVVASSQARFPPDAEGSPPFYRILLPGLRADLLSLVPDRRDQSAALARAALDLARAAYPPYAPIHAEKLVRCLFLAGRLEEAKLALSEAEPLAVEQGHMRALSALWALRVATQVAAGDGAADIDAVMSALHEALDSTGSPRIAAETLLTLARMLPAECTHPDPLTLAEVQAERFAEMPMLANEELCRETRGDILLARGFRAEAGACFAAAKKRLLHYGLLLRVPLLERKRAHAEESSPTDHGSPQPTVARLLDLHANGR